MASRPAFKILATLAFGLAGATVAQAAPMVTDWGYSVTTEWGNGVNAPAPVYTGGDGTQVNNATMLSWGANNLPTQAPINTGDPETSRSGLVITPAGPVTNPPNLITNGGNVDTHTITHFNSTIASHYATLSTASVFTTLTLSPLLPNPPYGAGSLPTLSRTFQVDFVETSNNAPCGFPSGTVCDDIFVMKAGDLTQQFTFQGWLYTLNILATGLGPLDDLTCAAAGEASGCSGFKTAENANTPAQFKFNISAVPVPEPDVLALLGLGLAAAGYFGRRRKA